MDMELPNFSLQFEDALESSSKTRDRLSDEQLEKFIVEQRNPRTKKKTDSDIRKFTKFIEEAYSEKRNITNINTYQLDNYLCHFLLEIRKPDGSEYEPDSLTSFRNSIDRHLRQERYKYSLVNSLEFSKHREILKLKRKQLKADGLGRKKNAAQPLSKTDRQKLYDKGFLGSKDANTLQATVWMNNCLHFGMRTGQEHYDLKAHGVFDGNNLY